MIQHWKCLRLMMMPLRLNSSTLFFVFPSFLPPITYLYIVLLLAFAVVTIRATPPSHAASAFLSSRTHSLTDEVGLGAAPDSGIQREAVICPSVCPIASPCSCAAIPLTTAPLVVRRVRHTLLLTNYCCLAAHRTCAAA